MKNIEETQENLELSVVCFRCDTEGMIHKEIIGKLTTKILKLNVSAVWL